MADSPEKPAASSEQQPEQTTTTETPDLDMAVVLKHPKVQEYVQQREAQVEAHWKPRYEKATQEVGKKSATWSAKEKSLTEALEEAQTKLEAAQLSGDAEAIAKRLVQLGRAERELTLKQQQMAEQEAAWELKRQAQDIFGAHPGLSEAFRADALRRLESGTPPYVIEREASLQAAGVAPAKTSAASTGPALSGSRSSGSAQTKEQIMDDYIHNPSPETRKAYESLIGR